MNFTFNFAVIVFLIGSLFSNATAQKSKAKNARLTSPLMSNIDLSDPHKKDIVMKIVASAENSTLDWKKQYAYIEDIKDGRGYTGGIVGFTSGTDDMLQLVRHYTELAPNNILAKYLPALQKVNGTDSHEGLDPNFTQDWAEAAKDILFQQSQDWLRDLLYFDPAVKQGKADGLHALGQFIYFDALVMHGPGDDKYDFNGIRRSAIKAAKPPSQGGNEKKYLTAFLEARKKAMRSESSHRDTSRVDTAQRVFLNKENFDLNTPLKWKVYGDDFEILQ